MIYISFKNIEFLFKKLSVKLQIRDIPLKQSYYYYIYLRQHKRKVFQKHKNGGIKGNNFNIDTLNVLHKYIYIHISMKQ